MGYTKEEKAMIWLDSFPLDRAKKAAALRLAREPYALAARFAALERALAAELGEGSVAAMRASLADEGYLRGLFASYEREGIVCVTCFSPLYPEALRAAEDPPLVLYCKGDVSLLKERKFAIVGSRRTPPHILRRTERLSEGLSRAFVIVTGHADGGDSAAIAGALASGKLIVVLAFGIARIAEAENAALLQKAGERGLLVSEYLPGQTARRYTFPARNRIIAGLSDGVLVVSGGEKSGTRITAHCAYALGRDVFAFPYAAGDPLGAGCNKLIKEYAKLAEDLVDISSAFGIHLCEGEKAPLTPQEERVLACMGGEPVHISALATASGMKEAELAPVLTLLSVKKLAVSCGGNRWGKV